MKVYSWEDIKSGEVASKAALWGGRQQVLTTLHELYEKGWIESGLLYGSVARGDFSPGSDLDVLAVALPRYRKHVEHALRALYASLGARHVRMQLHFVTTKELAQGQHTISPYFLRHLVNVPQENQVGIPVSTSISMRKKSAYTEAQREITYLRQKMRKNLTTLSQLGKKRGPEYYKLLTSTLKLLSTPRDALLTSVGILRTLRDPSVRSWRSSVRSSRRLLPSRVRSIASWARTRSTNRPSTKPTRPSMLVLSTVTLRHAF